jgi:poly(A) polymerase/tRNA nucleotidyltransferase (CCA-adding enzyme)
MVLKIPKEVKEISDGLLEGGYKAYLVGGCVRDLFLKREPKDWDIATDAKPKDVQKLFPDSVYENEFGTVGVKTDSKDEKLKVVEVTTFRLEGRYSDKRHPDSVSFAKAIEDDLARRDFTVNAFALDLGRKEKEIIDPYGGRADLKAGMVRTVGEPEKRFEEDALRLLRAVRFAVELGFEIDHPTLAAMKTQSGLLEMIAKERIRDEFVKIIMTPRAAEGVILLEDTGLLKHIVPELREGIGCGQNRHHIYTVFDHNVRALNYAAEKKYSLEVRLASLFHDIGKPRSKRGEGPNSTFHGHEVIGARLAVKILDRLRFSKEVTERIVRLIRYHMFYYNVGDVSAAGVRRFLARVGPEYVDEIMKVREADRIGSNVPKAFPYKLRHLLFMIEKVKRDPIHPKMLKVHGEDVMKLLKVKPGPKIGKILEILLEEVLDDPKKNTRKYLEGRVKDLGELSDGVLGELADKAKETKEGLENDIEENMKKKYYVK